MQIIEAKKQQSSHHLNEVLERREQRGCPSFSKKNSPPFYSDIIKVISIMWKGTQKYTTDCSSSSRNCSRALHQKLPLFAWGKTSLRCNELIFFVWPIRSHGEKHVKMSLMHLRMCKKVLPTIDRLTRSCFFLLNYSILSQTKLYILEFGKPLLLFIYHYDRRRHGLTSFFL